MPSSLYVFTPGDLVHVQVDPRQPIRTFTVTDDGSMREIGAPPAYGPGPSNVRPLERENTLTNVTNGDLRNSAPAHSRAAK